MTGIVSLPAYRRASGRRQPGGHSQVGFDSMTGVSTRVDTRVIVEGVYRQLSI